MKQVRYFCSTNYQLNEFLLCAQPRVQLMFLFKKILLFRELSLIMTGRGWKRSCRVLKFFLADLLGSETIDKHLVGVSN